MPPRRVSLSAQIVSWIVIAVVLALHVLPSVPAVSRAIWRSRSPSHAIAPPGPQLTFMSRYLIAYGNRAAISSNDPSHKLLADLATTPADRLRLIAVDAELGVGQPPLQRIDTLLKEKLSDNLLSDAHALQIIYRHDPSALSPAQRDDLVDHHRWFGRLMLAYRQDKENPDRRAAYGQATRAVAAGTVISLAMIAALVAGIAALVILIVRYFSGSLRARYLPPPFPSTEFLESFALYLALFTGVGLLLYFLVLKTRLGLSATWFTLPLVLFAALYPRLRGVPSAEWRYAMGYHTGRGVFIEIGSGLLGYAALFPFFVLCAFLVSFVSKRCNIPTPNPIVDQLPTTTWGIVNFYLLTCLWAPLVEETFFRGAFYHHLRGQLGFWPTAVLVAIAFAALHAYGLLGNVLILILGLGFVLIRTWRSTIVSSMAAHCLHNFIMTTVALTLYS